MTKIVSLKLKDRIIDKSNASSNNSAILLISRLPIHGAFLSKALSTQYQITWIGKSFPFCFSIFNALYIIFNEFLGSLLSFGKLHFRLIIVQFVSVDGLIAVFFKYFFKTKFVLFAVGSDVLKIHQHVFFYPLLKLTIKHSDLVFCASDQIEKRLLLMGFNPSKVQVIPSVVDISGFKKYSGSKIYDVINIGTLDLNKNQMLILDACKLLPSVNAVIIGEGPMRKDLELKSTIHHLNVLFTGKLLHERVFQKLQEARVYVHTSLSEGLPAAVLEALYVGLPVVLMSSSYAYTLRQQYGFIVHIVESDSPELLANCIDKILENYDSESRNSSINKSKVTALFFQTTSDLESELAMLLKA